MARPKPIETSNSPPPNFYRNQQAKGYLTSKKPPLATIGKTKRFLIDAPLSKVPATPGPSDYKI